MLKYLFLLWVVALFLEPAFANDEMPKGPQPPGNEGHGGHGIVEDGIPYLVDLAENGVEKKPYFETELEKLPSFKKVKERIGKTLDEVVDEKAVSLLALKLMEIHKTNELLAISLLQGIEKLEWFALSQDLFKLQVPYPVIVGDIVTLALRQDDKVRLNQKYVEKMRPDNQAALIFHEVAYALEKLRFIKDVEWKNEIGGTVKSKVYELDGKKTRSLTGLVFSKKIKDILKREEAIREWNEYYSSKDCEYGTIPLNNKEEILKFKVAYFTSTVLTAADWAQFTLNRDQKLPDLIKRVCASDPDGKKSVLLWLEPEKSKVGTRRFLNSDLKESKVLGLTGILPGEFSVFKHSGLSLNETIKKCESEVTAFHKRFTDALKENKNVFEN